MSLGTWLMEALVTQVVVSNLPPDYSNEKGMPALHDTDVFPHLQEPSLVLSAPASVEKQ